MRSKNISLNVYHINHIDHRTNYVHKEQIGNYIMSYKENLHLFMYH